MKSAATPLCDTIENADVEAHLKRARDGLIKLRRAHAAKLVEFAAKVDSVSTSMGWSEEDLAGWLQTSVGMPRSESLLFAKFGGSLGGRTSEIAVHGLSYSTIEALVNCDQSVHSEFFRRLSVGELLDEATLLLLDREAALLRSTALQAGRSRRQQAFDQAASSASARLVRTLEDGASTLLGIIDDSLRYDDWYGVAIDDETGEPLNGRLDRPLQAVDRISQQAATVLSTFISIFGTSHVEVASLLDVATHDDVEASIAFAWYSLNQLASCDFSVDQIERADRAMIGSLRPGIEFLAGGTILATPVETDRSRHVSPVRSLRFMDIGAGVGSAALGLCAAGYHPVAIYESGFASYETIKSVRGDWKPIRETGTYGSFRGQIDVLTHGAIWQSSGPSDKVLGDRFVRAATIVDVVQPRAFYFAVDPILGPTAGENISQDVIEQFDGRGYDLSWHTLDPSQFGIAQPKHIRLFVGIRSPVSPVIMPVVLGAPTLSLADIIADLVEAYLLYEHGDVAGSDRYRQWLTRCEGKPAPAFYRGGAKNSAEWAALDIHFSTEPLKQGLIPLTIEMIKRIQGYPKSWVLAGRTIDQEVNLTTSMPPIVAKMIGLAIHTALTGERFDFPAAFKKPIELAAPVMPVFRRTRFGNLISVNRASAGRGIRGAASGGDPAYRIRHSWEQTYGSEDSEVLLLDD